MGKHFSFTVGLCWLQLKGAWEGTPLAHVRCRQPLASRLSLEKFCYGWLHRRILRRYRLQCAVNCSALQEQTEGSGPSTNQVSLLRVDRLGSDGWQTFKLRLFFWSKNTTICQRRIPGALECWIGELGANRLPVEQVSFACSELRPWGLSKIVSITLMCHTHGNL